MIAAHGNSLRSIIMHLDKLTSQEVVYMLVLYFINYISLSLLSTLLVTHFFTQVISLELSTGIPLLYIFKEGKFIRRGSPAGPSEAGVYAYTKVRVFFCFLVGKLLEAITGCFQHFQNM
jgi:2,3-bisphosphoglycerate-dependent phosphoglycerate mutase